MASYKDILKEKDNQNWLKGSLALRITKAGLRGLVEGESHRVQQNIHSSVLHARHLAAGTTCSLCLTEHVLPCPRRGLCSHPRNCKYHNTPFKIHRPCPSQICDDFRDEICAVHRYSGPSWKNTKANQWCTNHWQVAKCFMPPDGYHDVTSYDETDFNGIISVMINCTEFQRRMSFPIGNQPNALTEARVVGRNIRHSPDLKLTDTDLADYFATLNTLLTDSTFLASDMDAQQAVLKLQQLEKGTLPITTEEVRELLEEARATVETGIESGKRQLVETTETGKKDIEGVVSQGKLEFEDAIKTGKRNLEGVVTQGKLHLEDAMTTARVVTERGKLEIEDAVAKSRDTVQVGKRELEEALQKMKALSTLSEAEQREDLRQRLVKYYQKQLNSAPISPLLSDKDERLDKFYVPPKIEEKDHRRLGDDQQQNGSPISSYKQIFCKEKGLANTVFVVGEAGMGKSSFSAMCTIKWAAQFSVSCRDAGGRGLDQDIEEKTSLKLPLLNKKCLNQGIATKFIIFKSVVIREYNVAREFQELYDSLSDDGRSFVLSHGEEFCELLSQPKYDLFQDEDTLRDIEFMFHIKLRDCCESCELSDMIRDQLINIIYRSDEMAAGYSTMISVLSNRKCVVIADGLDEWTHPTETKCSCSLEDKVIPHLSQTLDATVLITSRPWRLSQNRVKDTKIGAYLEIKGVASTPLLVQKTLVCLNGKEADKRLCHDFIRFVARRRLVRLLSVPIIVLLLVCLWFEGVHESFSFCDIYAYMMDMMFGRKSLPVLSVSPECTPLLKCFKQTKHVQNYYNIVLKLAQLAFEKLFSRDRKSSLVFQNVDCLTQEELLFVLKSGIMRETKSQSLIRKSSSFSFIHKTVQEFLAAVHSYHAAVHEDVQEFLPIVYPSKDSSMADVSHVFLFMCGINREVAQYMSAMMSNAVSEKCVTWMYDDWAKTVQQALCAGHREALANNVQNIQLELMCLYIDPDTRDFSTLKTLISMNKSQLRHITICGHEEEFSEEELQALFNSSKHTLTLVEIRRRAGQYDLSACCRLQYLTISGPSNITINTNSLVELELSDVSEKVESSIVQSLEHNCEQLMEFNIGHIKNISLFVRHFHS
ncbi:uncharacterized protein LOC128233966 [Mya arenaria]|uniref:uncharacterized protein LOC128233966 n=1 Tax=Mya arenaria TaxID=6604 RepID=UPI0022E48032|nr:uncharacterized protein LOC128233966 [Mya arenaria]XP_052803829.1 uncharacterized protein LOC128233966 [Mya arenaria]XP_052803830.1 uncharacterized protein LOC128233966 [Mya arenaria]